jgi:4-amino-4-deoxy-L-arabinose transferase-like glycosyltransferase
MTAALPHSSDISRRFFIAALFASFLGAFGLRVAMTAAFQGLNSPPSHDLGLDQLDYELFAHHLSTGEGYVTAPGVPTARRTPGTSLALLPVYTLAGRSYLAARLWWCLLSAVTTTAVGLLGAVAWSRTAGALAAALSAFYPGHFYYAMHFVSEVPFGLWLAFGLLTLLLAFRRISFVMAAASGLCWGLAILTRSQIALVFPLLIVVSLGVVELRRHWRIQLVTAIAAATIVTPWVMRNYLVFGKPTMALLLPGYTFWGAHNDIVLNDPKLQGLWIVMDRLVDEAHPLQGTEVDRDAAGRRYGREWLHNHWGNMPWLTVMKIWRLLTPFEATGNRAVYAVFALSWIVIAPFVACGLWMGARQRPVETLVIALPLLATVVSTVLFYGSIRFRDAVSPTFLVFASVPLAALCLRMFSQRQPIHCDVDAQPHPSEPLALTR